MLLHRYVLEADMEIEEVRHLNDCVVLSKLRLMPPNMITRMLRLNLLARLAVKGEKQVWHMLLLAAPSPTSWLSVVARDLKSISQLSPFEDMVGWTIFNGCSI